MKSKTNKISPIMVVCLLVLLVVTVIGLQAIFTTLSEGHIHTNTTQHVPWGLWVAGYVFFLGLSAGSFLLSTLVYVFKIKKLEPVGPLALTQALVCLLLGGMLIALDLGHPERMYKIWLSPNSESIMSWMGNMYVVYILVIIAELYFVLRSRFAQFVKDGTGPTGLYRFFTLGRLETDEKSRKTDYAWLMRLGIFGILVAVIVHGGVGGIFAFSRARPYWFGGLFPIFFLVSALASGGALLTFLAAFIMPMDRVKKLELVRSLAILTVGLLAIDALLLTSEIVVSLYAANTNENESWAIVLTGAYKWVFWWIQIMIGMVIPFIIVGLPSTRNSTGWLGTAGALVVVGMMGARLNIVIPGQIIPAFKTMAEAYHHTRFELGYYPSSVEWLAAIGVAAIGVWLVFAAHKLLPLYDESAEKTA